MKNIPETADYFLDLFRRSLSRIYREQEITSLFRILVRHRLGWSAADLHMRMAEALPGQGAFLQDALVQLAKGKPVQYITGSTEFRGLDLTVSEAVLIPRPETEEMVELIIRENKQKQFQRFSVLDLGTGSGCIAIALRNVFPYADVDALDNSGEALKVADENAVRLGLPVRFMEHDILDPRSMQSIGGYDLIVSNPPYVTEAERAGMHPNVLEYEPPGALFVPDDDPLKYYRAIATFGWEHLTRPGTLYLEINERFGNEVFALLTSCGFEKVAVHRDLGGKDRFITASVKSLMKDTSYWMVDKDLPDLT